METINFLNPATGEVLGKINSKTPDEVREAFQNSKKAFIEWSQKSIADRIAHLKMGQTWLKAHLDEVVDAISLNNGKPKVESMMADVAPVIQAISYYAKHAEDLLEDEPISIFEFLPTKKAHLTFSPLGVIGVISPWNYPFNIPMGEVIAALIAGNCVILKPSEVTSLVNQKIQALMDACKLPKGVFQMIEGGALTGATLTSLPLDRIIFTGSVATGKKVMKSAADNLVPVSLELGGKDPCIVLDDVNIDIAASGALVGGFYNNGQTCCSIERLLVHKKIEKEFIAALEAKAKKLRVAPSVGYDNDIGPITYEPQKKIIKSQLDDFEGKPSTIYDGKNNFLPPVIIKTSTDKLAWNDETFGPLICYDTFETEDEAVAKANASVFGLGAVIWSGSTSRARALAKRIYAGTVVINDAPYTNAITALPWGGVKHSGMGRVHGKEGLRDMCLSRVVTYDIQGQAKQLWWFPYSFNHYNFLKAFVMFSAETSWLKKIALVFALITRGLKVEKRL